MAILPAIESVCAESGISARAATHSATPPTPGFLYQRNLGINAQQIDQYSTAVLRYAQSGAVSAVILVGYWEIYGNMDAASFSDAILRTVDRLQAAGVSVYFMKDVPAFSFDVPRALVRCSAADQDLSKLGMMPADYRVVNRFQASILPKLAERGVHILDPVPILRREQIPRDLSVRFRGIVLPRCTSPEHLRRDGHQVALFFQSSARSLARLTRTKSPREQARPRDERFARRRTLNESCSRIVGSPLSRLTGNRYDRYFYTSTCADVTIDPPASLPRTCPACVFLPFLPGNLAFRRSRGVTLRIDAGGTDRYCDGLSRRSFVQLGVAGMATLGLADVLRAKAQSAPNLAPSRSTAPGRSTASGHATKPGHAIGTKKSVILIWLDGGPSHLDLYDLKPEAPSEVRGIWRPIRTNVPGFEISELFPKQAKIADKFSIVRSLFHGTGDHFAGGHRMLTSKEMGVSGASQSGRFPSIGSIVAQQRGPNRRGMPAYIAVPIAASIGLVPGYFGGNWLGCNTIRFKRGAIRMGPSSRCKISSWFPD